MSMEDKNPNIEYASDHLNHRNLADAMGSVQISEFDMLFFTV